MRTLKLILLFPLKLINLLTSGIPVILYNVALAALVCKGVYNMYVDNGIVGTIVLLIPISLILCVIFSLLNSILSIVNNITDAFASSWDSIKATNNVDYKIEKTYTLKYFYKEQQKEEQNLSRSLT